MKVVYFQRKPGPKNFSIERVFEDIRFANPVDIRAEVNVCKLSSRGLLNRIYEVFRAATKQGDINHITGDIHFLALLLKRKRTILTIHDCVTLERLTGVRYWIYWFFWYWLPIKRSTVITVISESTKRELQSHLKIESSQIEIIPDCVSPEFEPHQKIFNAQYPRILQIGTKSNKNIERIAAALEGLPCCLVVIGQLSTRQATVLNNHGIDVENHIGISGDELIKQYQKADLLMFASLYEGFGLPILESNAVGRPVITSNLYSMPEVGGDAACYVDPFDTTCIRSAVEKILEDSKYRDQLIENGFRNVERFRAENVATKYADLYRRVLIESGRDGRCQ